VAPADATTWFVVDGPNGPLLTRNGGFTLNDLNQLITRSGLVVRGQAGRITIPPQTATVNFGTEGAVIADGVIIDNLLLASIQNPTSMIRVGDTLFQGPTPNGPPIPGSVRVVQGLLEQPNQNVVVDMVGMLQGLRHYEAAQRSLRSLSEALALNTRPQA
jgi:flagellar basal-body rod protein FlgG